MDETCLVQERETGKQVCALVCVCEAERNGWRGEGKEMNRWREQRRRDVGVGRIRQGVRQRHT